MKECPICKAQVFEDMDTCYGCMYSFGAKDISKHNQKVDSTATNSKKESNDLYSYGRLKPTPKGKENPSHLNNQEETENALVHTSALPIAERLESYDDQKALTCLKDNNPYPYRRSAYSENKKRAFEDLVGLKTQREQPEYGGNYQTFGKGSFIKDFGIENCRNKPIDAKYVYQKFSADFLRAFGVSDEYEVVVEIRPKQK